MIKQFYYFTLTNRMLAEKQYLQGIKFIVRSRGSNALILKGFQYGPGIKQLVLSLVIPFSSFNTSERQILLFQI